MTTWNLTPHAFHLFAQDATTLVCEIASRASVRLRTADGHVGGPYTLADAGTAPLVPAPVFTGVEPLPALAQALQEGEPCTGIIVSMAVAQFLQPRLAPPSASLPPGQIRVFIPDTSPANAVRSESGQIRGARALCDWGSIARNALIHELRA